MRRVSRRERPRRRRAGVFTSTAHFPRCADRWGLRHLALGVAVLTVLLFGTSRVLWHPASAAAAQPACAYAGLSNDNPEHTPQPAYYWCELTASFSGSWHYQDNTPNATDVSSLSWSESWNGSYWVFQSLSGTYTYTDLRSGSTDSCSATLSLNPADAPYYGQTPLSGNQVYSSNGDPADEPGISVLGAGQLDTTGPVYPYAVVQSSVTDPSSPCNTNWSAGAAGTPYLEGVPWTGSDCHDGPSSTPFPDLQLPVSTTLTDSCTAAGPDQGSGGTLSGSVQSTLAISWSNCAGATDPDALGSGLRQPAIEGDTPGCCLTSTAGADTAHASAATITVETGGPSHFVENPRYVTLTANAAGGCQPYTFVWTLKPRRTEPLEAGGYGSVTPASKTQSGAASQVKVVLACKGLPSKVRRNSPESWRPCWGPVTYNVAVTDAAHNTGSGTVTFLWQPFCVSASRKALAKKLIEDLGHAIWDELSKSVQEEIAKKGGEKLITYLLETGEGLGPYLLAHGLIDLTAKIGQQIQQANTAREDLKYPVC